jgi:peptidyl-prolyl cis-trans isomerase D
MLQTFRVIINSFVGKVFFGILVLTFGLLGVGYGFRDLLLGVTTQNDAATVGGIKITLNDLDRQYRRQLQSYQRQQGASFNPNTQQKQALVNATLDQAINDALFAEKARDAGFRVGDAMIRKVIEQEPAFAGEDKRFDPGHFRMVLETQGLNEATFVPMIRGSLTRQLLINPIATSATAPKFLVDNIYRYRNEQRVAQTVLIPNTAATGIAAPSDADVDAYYKKHAAEFTAPEYRTFTVLSLTPDLFTAEIKPTDDELHAAYDQHKSEYVVPEKRKVTQLIAPDKATGDAIVKAMEAGKSMADAAKAATNGKVQAIPLDFLTKDTFPEALRVPVFTASKGAPIGPIQTLLGWHVVQVDDIQAGQEVAFDDVKAKLTDEVKHDTAIDRLSQQVDKLGDRLTGGASMDDVGAGVGAKPVKFGPVDAKGNSATPDVGKPAPVKPADGWVASAFQLQQGETGSFQDDKAGGYYAVRLDSVTPPALRPLADVRTQIVAGWTKEQQAAQIAKRADELAAKARSGTLLTQIAADSGGKLDSTPPVTRDPVEKPSGAVPQALTDALFRLDKVGDITTVTTDNGQIIARLSEIRPADPQAAGAKLAPIMQELDSQMRADSLAQYRDGLRQSTKIKINPTAVETVAGQ